MNKLGTSVVVSKHDAAPGTMRSYTTGFILSLVLTFAAYLLVKLHSHISSSSTTLVTVIIVSLAIAQLGVQLIYFLHLSHRSTSRWNLTILAFAAIVVVILVFGSLWIMHNLNTRMTTQQTNRYLQSQDGL